MGGALLEKPPRPPPRPLPLPPLDMVLFAGDLRL